MTVKDFLEKLDMYNKEIRIFVDITIWEYKKPQYTYSDKFVNDAIREFGDYPLINWRIDIDDYYEEVFLQLDVQGEEKWKR